MKATLRFDPPLIPGRLIRRENRFIASIALDDGRTVEAHCTNTGSLMGVLTPGARVWLRAEPGATRRTAYTWILVRHRNRWVGIDTLLPNRLGFQVASRGAIPELAGYADVRREVPAGVGTRLDLLLTAPRRRRCWVEIKNCHLTARTLDPGVPGPAVPRRLRDIALFPDAPTARGRKHLAELSRLRAAGHRCVLLVVIQRDDVDAFGPAAGIDPDYAIALAEAIECGVEVVPYTCTVSPTAVRLARRLPLLLP